MPDQDTENIIQSASGGLALCGIRMDGGKHSRRLRSIKQILQCPAPSKCQLQAPIEAGWKKRLEFSSEEECVQFLDTVAKSGWNMALDMSPCVNTSIDHGSSQSVGIAQSTREAERCTMQICYTPTRSFRIPKQHMQLSDEAIADLQGVLTESDAKEFLEQYHSHVSTGVFHLGAIYAELTISGLRAQSSSVATERLSELTAAGGATFYCKAALAKTGIRFHRGKQSAARGGAIRTENSETRVTWALGVSAEAIKDIDAFLESVPTSPSSWAIINSTHTIHDLVPVWEVVLNSTCTDRESLRKPAELLCTAWQSEVAGIVEDDDVFKLHQASITSKVNMPTEYASEVQGPVCDNLVQEGASTTGLGRADSSSRLLDSPSQLIPHLSWLPRGCINGAEDYPGISDKDGIKSSTSTAGDTDSMLRNSEAVTEGMEKQLAAAKDQQKYSKHTPLSGTQVREGTVGSNTRFETGPQFTFINDFLTHRPFPQPDKYKNFIDRISHALLPFENFKQQLVVVNEDAFWGAPVDPDSSHSHTKGGNLSSILSWNSQMMTKFWSGATDGAGVSHSSEEEDPVIEEAEAAKSIVYIYMNSDFLGQIGLLRLLFDQRWGVPLVFSSSSPARNSSPSGKAACFHTMQALNYVFSTIGRAKSSAHDLVLETDMPRVVFLSNHSNREHERIAQEVTKFRFLPFPYRDEDQALYVQLGMGFLPQNKRPYLAVVASGAGIFTGGDQQCIKFLNEIADVVFLQVRHSDLQGGSNVNALLTCETILQWAIHPSGVPGRNPATKQIWGSSSDVANDLTRYLGGTKWSQLTNLGQEGRRHLRSICTTYFEAPRSDILVMDKLPEGLEDTLKQTDFQTLRDQLVLQNSFLCEATARFESLKLRHDREQMQEKLRECNKEIQKRVQDAQRVAHLPIIQHFLKVLQHKEASSRTTCILDLKNSMQERSHKALAKWSQQMEWAFNDFQKNPTEESQKRYNHYREQHARKVVGLEHLWREVCHMFLSNPQGHSEVPKLAARHLLDGFPLEILDGDAKFFNDVWVRAVLLEAEQLIMQQHAADHSGRTHAPRILVLSVLGTQSSGKTTLLNVMFGTNLPTKAGRCTCGVHIQLIKSGWSEYDYILLMDTEGIKAPEQYGALQVHEQYLSHDNRMATFAILPSDATIMVVAGEDDSSLKDVLPLVLMAFKGSTVAQKNGGRLRSKMLFVYRSVDINECNELRSNQQALLAYLVGAERHIRGPPAHISGGKLGGDVSLLDFRVADKEELSDVKLLGSYRSKSTPPEDIPDSQYGEGVIQLRDYLHNRVIEDANWTPFDLKELGSYMDLVWNCILQADFELSFKSRVEYSSYMELQQMLQVPRTLVSRAYVEELEELKNTSLRDDTSLVWLQFCKVQATINEQSKRVEEILQNSRWLITWKAEEGKNWKQFLKQQEQWFNMQLHNYKTGVIQFEKLVSECDKRMQQDIIALRGLPHNDRQAISFETMFSNFLKSAEKLYEPSADSVEALVNSVYTRHKSIFESLDVVDGALEGDQFEQTCLEDLKVRILADSLNNAKQYSDDLVERAITLTSEFIRKHPITYDRHRECPARVHANVKEFVTLQLRGIQKKWDGEHNPAVRLKEQRDRFQNLYNIHTNGYEMTNLLLEELKSVFTESLKSDLRESIAKMSCSSLQGEPWLVNWKVMRGLLDALLLKLLEEGKDACVLDFVSDGGLYQRNVVEELIKSNLGKTAKTSLRQLRLIVKDAVSCASRSAMAIRSQKQAGRTAVFRDELIMKLALQMHAFSRICGALQRISPDASTAEDGEILNFADILTPKLHRTIDEICDDVENQLDNSASPELRGLADMVKERLTSYANPSYRMRCEKACPRCGITCFLPANHVTCHQTMHQPQGLKGTVWETTQQLSEKTCTEHYRDDDVFTLAGSTSNNMAIRYREFNKQYPDWESPAIGHDVKHPLSSKVRQCLFYHCQRQLVKQYPWSKVNDRCAHFAHPIAQLRYQIEMDLPEDLRACVGTLAASLAGFSSSSPPS
eukprot:c25412_g1_i1 orf=330-6386(+)